LSELQQARQLDPTSIIVAENLAIALDYSGRSEEALQQLAAASEIEPSGARPHYRRLMILDRLRRDDDAIKARLEMARLTDRVAEAEGLSRLFTTAGYDAVLDHVMRLHGERGEHMQGAFAAMALKRQDAALTFLEACVRSRDRVVPFIKVDPAFAPLTGHPRFVKILRQAGL
jgi:tetratricopeptide (TPR) repeat protein